METARFGGSTMSAEGVVQLHNVMSTQIPDPKISNLKKANMNEKFMNLDRKDDSMRPTSCFTKNP